MSGEVVQLKHEGSQLQVVVAGAIAGVVSRFVIAPLDVIKIRLQLQVHSLSDPLSTRGFEGTIGTFRSILRDEGFTGLWKGNVPAELMYLCYGGVQFSTYKYTSTLLETLPSPYELPGSAVSFISGATAGACATTATYPLDLLRTRFAAQGTERVYTSLGASIRHIAKHEGPTAFFRGLGAGVSQIVPYMGLFFASYEALKPAMANSPLALPFGGSDAAAGIIASVCAKTAVYPLDTTRKRLQVQGPMRSKYAHRNIPMYSGVIGTLATISKREGMRGLYRGLTVSLVKAAPAASVTMWTYERAIAGMLMLEDKAAAE
ncbi:mitochondrial deoxynucleotide carrier [Karstenula rhodostoma CBS 690.94]|uniref:Mitochondrial thiamine pyrophosphate carrier 1 n=1 Tax=Karstenula rhodostoma CBS 690.94 TaxID=1392251 RepID=A0A9P4U9T6_9PLEO|nr:mitochondrial deoxynucleotide carrier [Karstenula rhodostoma CBS 690.94]